MQPWIKATHGSKHDVADLVTEWRQKKIARTTPPETQAVALSLGPSLLFTPEGLLEGPSLKSQAGLKSPVTAR